jgi:hypothetical protein
VAGVVAGFSKAKIGAKQRFDDGSSRIYWELARWSRQSSRWNYGRNDTRNALIVLGGTGGFRVKHWHEFITTV